jgi:uncharacterized protein YoxC
MSDDLVKRVADLEESVKNMVAQLEKLAVSLVEYKKQGDTQTKAAVEDLRKQVATVAGRLGINTNQPRGKGFQVRAPGPITNVTRPITRRR